MQKNLRREKNILNAAVLIRCMIFLKPTCAGENKKTSEWLSAQKTIADDGDFGF